MDNILKSKSKDDVLKSLKNLLNISYENFLKYTHEYQHFYKENIEYYPLYLQITETAKRNNYTIYHNQVIQIKNYTFYLYDKKDINTVIISMFPLRKIKELENLRSGNTFKITSLNQYLEIENFIKKL